MCGGVGWGGGSVSRRPRVVVRAAEGLRERISGRASLARASARIKNPRRRYDRLQHGHHVTLIHPGYGNPEYLSGWPSRDRGGLSRHPARRHRSIILRSGVSVSSRDRSMCVVRRSVGPPRSLCHGGRPGGQRRLGSRRSNVASCRATTALTASDENNFKETHLKSDLNIAHRRSVVAVNISEPAELLRLLGVHPVLIIPPTSSRAVLLISTSRRTASRLNSWPLA